MQGRDFPALFFGLYLHLFKPDTISHSKIALLISGLYNEAMNNIRHVCYNLVLSLWVGGITIFTFLVTPAIFNSFERDMAGKIVEKLFPGYFAYILALSVLAFILLLIMCSQFTISSFKLSMALVIIGVIINLFVAFWLHPEIRKVKQEIHSIKTLADDSALRQIFGRFHAVSASLNLLVLADGITLLVISTGLKKQ